MQDMQLRERPRARWERLAAELISNDVIMDTVISNIDCLQTRRSIELSSKRLYTISRRSVPYIGYEPQELIIEYLSFQRFVIRYGSFSRIYRHSKMIDYIHGICSRFSCVIQKVLISDFRIDQNLLEVLYSNLPKLKCIVFSSHLLECAFNYLLSGSPMFNRIEDLELRDISFSERFASSFPKIIPRTVKTLRLVFIGTSLSPKVMQYLTEDFEKRPMFEEIEVTEMDSILSERFSTDFIIELYKLSRFCHRFSVGIGNKKSFPFLSRIDNIYKVTVNVEKLTNDVGRWDYPLRRFIYFDRLTALQLQDVQLGQKCLSFVLHGLHECKNLETLLLRNCVRSFTENNFLIVNCFPSCLKRLLIYGCSFSDVELKAIPDACPELIHITLWSSVSGLQFTKSLDAPPDEFNVDWYDSEGEMEYDEFPDYEDENFTSVNGAGIAKQILQMLSRVKNLSSFKCNLFFPSSAAQDFVDRTIFPHLVDAEFSLGKIEKPCIMRMLAGSFNKVSFDSELIRISDPKMRCSFSPTSAFLKKLEAEQMDTYDHFAGNPTCDSVYEPKMKEWIRI